MRFPILFLLLAVVLFAVFPVYAAESRYVLKLEIGAEGAALLEVAETPGAYIAPRAELKRGADFRYELVASGGAVAAGYFRDPRRLSALFDQRFVAPGQAHHYNGFQESGIVYISVPALSGASLRLFGRSTDGKSFVQAQEFSLSAAHFVRIAQTKAATGDIEVIEQNGPADNRLNIIILGDGYTADQQSDLYDDAVWLVDEFSRVKPWNEYREFFNFNLVHVVSNESGADHPSQGIDVDTALEAQYDYAGLDRLLVVNDAIVKQIVRSAFPELLETLTYIFVLVNDETYGGSGGEVAVTSVNEYAPEILLHEAGHMIGDLADEYDDPWPGYVPVGEEANVTEEDDPAKIKWRVWIENGTPLPTPEEDIYADVVGLFEGARYQASGIYRPRLDCRMRALGVDFCEVCTEALLESMYVVLQPSDASGGEVYVYEGESVVIDAEPLHTTSNFIKVTWSLDDVPMENVNSSEYEVNADEMREGVHSLKALIFDDGGYIRRADALELARSTVEWTLIVEGGANPDGDQDNVTDGDSEIAVDGDDAFEDGDQSDSDANLQVDGDESPDGGDYEPHGSASDSGCSESEVPSGLFIVMCALLLLRRKTVQH